MILTVLVRCQTIKAVGIIAEYNPFHNGHRWHAVQAKARSGCLYSVAVVSGQFTQRGEPAAFDKWKRAAMAVKGGIDLVIELPAGFAVRSAQYFATGGVRLLNSLGVITHLAFGAENAATDALLQAADTHDDTMGPLIRDRMSQGMTYAAALAECLSSSDKHYEILSQPNNILAVEYLRAIRRFAPSLTPVIIPRMHSHYHDTDVVSPFASATAVRRALTEKNNEAIAKALPSASIDDICSLMDQGYGPVQYESLEQLILYKLRSSTLEQLAGLPDIAEGLHHKMASAALAATTLEQWLTHVKSKRYTRTRLQRALIHLILGMTKDTTNSFDESGPLYARVLAFNAAGRKILKQAQIQTSIPIITKMSHYLTTKQRSSDNLTPLQTMLSIDSFASDFYSLGIPNSRWRSGAADFRQSPVYIE